MSSYISLPLTGASPYWGNAVNTSASLPGTGAVTGEIILVLDTASLYYWDGAAWVELVDGLADVSGPASSTDMALVRFDGLTGKVLQDSDAVLDDSENLTGLNSVTCPTLRGSAAAGGDLQLSSTSDATKGNVHLGSASTYDEANDRLGLGTQSPDSPLHIRNDSDLSGAGTPVVRLENRNSVANSHAHLEYRRSRAANADLANGDLIGGQDYHPRHNGTSLSAAHAHVEYTGDGTTRRADFVFETSDNAAPAERLRVRYDGAVLVAGLTADRVLQTGANGLLEVSTVTDAELGYVSGVTSAIQTQLNAKADGAASSTDHAIARFDLATGKVLQNSGVTIDDSNNVEGAARVNATTAKIGGTGAAATSAVLELAGTTGALLLTRLTTAQRDALTAAEGMLIYNTDDDRFQGYFNGAWAALHGWGS